MGQTRPDIAGWLQGHPHGSPDVSVALYKLSLKWPEEVNHEHLEADTLYSPSLLDFHGAAIVRASDSHGKAIYLHVHFVIVVHEVLKIFRVILSSQVKRSQAGG